MPLITPAKVTASERLNGSSALLTMAPAGLPVVPPLPTWRVPAAIVVRRYSC